MWNQFQNHYFWFTQPLSFLSSVDWAFGYFSAVCVALSIVILVLIRFISNKVKSKLAKKFFYLLLSTGISGLIWFGLRFENTPIFAMRYWAGLVLVGAIIWLIFVLKYIIFNYFSELAAYERELLKSKYIPGSKGR